MFHSAFFCKKSGYKSIAYVVNPSTDIQNVRYYPNQEVYSLSTFTEKNYYYVNYYFTRGWLWSNRRHLVQFGYDLSLQHLCKDDRNQSEFELPLPWITHWVDYSPNLVNAYHVDLYADLRTFANATFQANMDTKHVHQNRTTGRSDGLYYGFSVFGTQSKQFVVDGYVRNRNEIFDGEHDIYSSCDRLSTLGKDQSKHLQWLWWLAVIPVAVGFGFLWDRYCKRR